jgi:NAD+ synthase (glutamine-hydrolysing)
MPIKFLHSAIKNVYKDSFGRELAGLANENIQSRLRGTLLYAHANDIGAIPINTSNKSEIAVGYSTLYGDSVGAISMLGDLYKTEVVTLANYINRNFDNLIPEQIITRKPTAELRENQADEDNLPPYSRLDTILEAILSYHMDIKDMLQLGFEEHEIKKVFNLYINSEYKRQQFCPIIKVKPKSFGFGYRVPITKDGRFYTNYNHKE